ncbi:hypothetical protein QFC21_004151 [Naganishia friedmannii]|uniref:Uncharacterized protein n=1 Tax=Naganishia friedmannii TaxID=89922 RepID=A0ACC2VK67_9TREE|nr:hypothetical protein QFC21_004151 [Naganishia friedmannii]
MFIALIGTPSAGKNTIARYLISQHGFQRIRLAESLPKGMNGHASDDTISPPDLGALQLGNAAAASKSAQPLVFPDVNTLLTSVTKTWQVDYVTTDLQCVEQVEPFVKRPFFLLVAVDGPLMTRFEREKAKSERDGQTLDLQSFVSNHDALMAHLPVTQQSIQTTSPTTTSTDVPPSISPNATGGGQLRKSGLKQALAYAQLSIMNNFASVDELERYLEEVDLVNAERLRPGWDTYFMTLASLASLRSNCMKRRVGALLVRSKRILSTGYNGTPRGLTNCNEGGCGRCNGSAKGGEAQENALLEAGRERVGEDAILYCNTCPCLRCSVKIVQTGVKEVVYNLNYSMDAQSAKVLREGGVTLRQLVMPHTST